jgi:hypothetical protein
MTLEEMGMFDPFRLKESIKEAKSCLRTFDFYIEVYP